MLKAINIKNLSNFKFYIVEVPRDGHCFFHSILFCTQADYRFSSSQEKNNRVLSFRKFLSELIDSKPPNSFLTYYDIINNGSTREFSNCVPEYSLKSMKETLNSNSPIGYGFFDFFSMVMNIDIYIINSSGDLYKSDEFNLSIKGNRECVLLHYTNGHYQPIILLDNDKFLYSFNYNSTVSTILKNLR